MTRLRFCAKRFTKLSFLREALEKSLFLLWGALDKAPFVREAVDKKLSFLRGVISLGAFIFCGEPLVLLAGKLRVRAGGAGRGPFRVARERFRVQGHSNLRVRDGVAEFGPQKRVLQVVDAVDGGKQGKYQSSRYCQRTRSRTERRTFPGNFLQRSSISALVSTRTRRTCYPLFGSCSTTI